MTRFAIAIAGCAMVAMLAHADAHAQSVHGRVLDEQGQPLSVALLTLVDEQGRAVRTGLSGDGGAFSISAGAAGRYTLRIERIGFATHTTPAFDLAAGERRTMPITVATAPIVLAAVHAEGARRCMTRPEDGSAIARLWEEARKALQITAIAEAGGAVRIGGVHYIRELDATARRQIAVQQRRDFRTSGVPFEAHRPDVLAKVGFAMPEGNTTHYFGPSAAVLLSDPFLEQHCFNRIVADRSDPRRVGLGFEPVRGSRVVGIAGTMWLDRETAEITVVEYVYRDPANRLRGGEGRVDFARLPNGLPHVSRWWIRMPLIVEEDARGRQAPRVIGLLEEGGIVLDVSGSPHNADDEVLAALNAAAATDERFVERRVTQTALDSIAARGLGMEDVVRRFDDVLRIERGSFWSYDHAAEDILCVEPASPLPRSSIRVGGLERRGQFCSAVEIFLDGEPVEAPGRFLRNASPATFAYVELLGAGIASQRLRTQFDEPILLLKTR